MNVLQTFTDVVKQMMIRLMHGCRFPTAVFCFNAVHEGWICVITGPMIGRIYHNRRARIDFFLN